MMVKGVVLLVMAIMIAQPVKAADKIDLSTIPFEKVEEIFSCDALQKGFQQFMRTFLEKNRACKSQFKLKDNVDNELVSCGRCCESEYGSIKPIANDWTHPCMYPKACAADLEDQYCHLMLWRQRVHTRCGDVMPPLKLAEIMKD